MTLSKFLESSSVATIETAEASSSSDSSDGISVYEAVERKTVRFATTRTTPNNHNGSDIDDDVLCEVHSIEKHDNTNLWWQEDEVANTRAQCFRLVKSKTQNQKYLRAATVHFLKGGDNDADLLDEMKQCSDERGLEYYIVRECANMVQEQHKSVLDVQSNAIMAASESLITVTAAESLIRVASRVKSEAFVGLAILRAKYDAEEAKKVYQGEEEYICVDRPPCLLPFVPFLD
eukprot:scaffold6164_cov163-Amphora_coffeaeformis.AAC.6